MKSCIIKMIKALAFYSILSASLVIASEDQQKPATFAGGETNRGTTTLTGVVDRNKTSTLCVCVSHDTIANKYSGTLFDERETHQLDDSEARDYFHQLAESQQEIAKTQKATDEKKQAE